MAAKGDLACGNNRQRKVRLEKVEPRDSEVVSHFCSDSPSPGGRGWGRQLLIPLLFGGVLCLGQWKTVLEGSNVCCWQPVQAAQAVQSRGPEL